MGFPLIYRPNSLVFPGWREPGFDSSHPAAKNIWISAIPNNANYVNLLTGAVGTITGTAPTSQVFPLLGPVTKWAAASGTNAVLFPWSFAFSTTMTVAAFFYIFTLGTGFQTITATAGNVTGGGFALTTDNKQMDIGMTGVADHPLLNVVQNVPYFFAGSANTARINQVLVRLDTGQVFSGSTTSSTATSPTSKNILIGAQNSAPNMYIGPVTWSAQFMSLAQLLAWAQRPWDFWYPPRAEELIFSSLSIPIAAAAVTKRFLPIMGVGR